MTADNRLEMRRPSTTVAAAFTSFTARFSVAWFLGPRHASLPLPPPPPPPPPPPIFHLADLLDSRHQICRADGWDAIRNAENSGSRHPNKMQGSAPILKPILTSSSSSNNNNNSSSSSSSSSSGRNVFDFRCRKKSGGASSSGSVSPHNFHGGREGGGGGRRGGVANISLTPAPPAFNVISAQSELIARPYAVQLQLSADDYETSHH